MPTPMVDQPDRRSFLRRGVVCIGTVLVPTALVVPAAGAQGSSDEDLAAFAESIELVAVSAYDAGAELLSADLAPLLQTYRAHHDEHAAAFAAVAGSAATGEPNAALLAALTPVIEAFSSQNDVLTFAEDLENQLAVTHGHLLSRLEASDAVATAASILPVETSHAAELSYELDRGPQAWFPSGAFESADIALGLDPAVFPVT